MACHHGYTNRGPMIPAWGGWGHRDLLSHRGWIITLTHLFCDSSDVAILWWALTRDTHIHILCSHFYVSIYMCLSQNSFSLIFSTVFLPGSYQLVKPLITIHKCVFNLIAEPFLSPHTWEMSLARSVSVGLELHPQSTVTLPRPRHLATLLTTTAAICLALCLCYAHSIRTSPRISALCLLFFSGFNNYGGRQYLFFFFFLPLNNQLPLLFWAEFATEFYLWEAISHLLLWKLRQSKIPIAYQQQCHSGSTNQVS